NLRAAADGLSIVTDDGILTAADHFQQHAPRAGVRNLDGVEVADRRELPIGSDRKPVIEHGSMFPPLRRIDRLERIQQALGRGIFNRFHLGKWCAHSYPPRLLSRGRVWPRPSTKGLNSG